MPSATQMQNIVFDSDCDFGKVSSSPITPVEESRATPPPPYTRERDASAPPDGFEDKNSQCYPEDSEFELLEQSNSPTYTPSPLNITTKRKPERKDSEILELRDSEEYEYLGKVDYARLYKVQNRKGNAGY